MQAKPEPCPECEELPITDFDVRDTDARHHTYCPSHPERGGQGRTPAESIEQWNGAAGKEWGGAAVRLYEIAEEYRRACEEVIDPETGEILPADTDALDEIADKLEDKVSNVAKIRAEMKAEADALRAEEKRIADRRRSLERREASLSDYVLFCMEAAGVNKLKSPTHTVWLQTSISVEVEGDVPDDFCVVEKRPDKKAIRALLDSGEPVSWARLSQKRGVRFR